MPQTSVLADRQRLVEGGHLHDPSAGLSLSLNGNRRRGFLALRACAGDAKDDPLVLAGHQLDNGTRTGEDDPDRHDAKTATARHDGKPDDGRRQIS